MIEKLYAIKERFQTVSELIIDPDVISDMSQYIKLNKEYKDLEPIVKVYKVYRDLIGNIADAKEIISTTDDMEMKEMAKMDLDENLPKKEKMD